MKNWLHKYKIAIFICTAVVAVCCVPFIWECWFFGEYTTIAEKLKYVGAFVGGILVATNAFFIYKRAEALNQSNNLTIEGQKLIAKGQLDTRFKDAATLLAQGNTSAELSGIYALHQIAIEASKTESQENYVKVVKEILIAFIKDNSVIDYKKDENGEILLDNVEEPKIIEKANNKKSKIVLQAIVDKLFRDGDCETYAKYGTNLSETALEKVHFWAAQLRDARFTKLLLQNAFFLKADLQGASFELAQLQDANFMLAELKNVTFKYAQLQDVNFMFAQLQDASFYGTQLQDADFRFAKLQDTNFENAHDIDKAHFYKTSWNKKTNFKGTAFENKTIEELTEIMGNPPEE